MAKIIKHIEKILKYGQKLDKTAWNMAKIQHGENYKLIFNCIKHGQFKPNNV